MASGPPPAYNPGYGPPGQAPPPAGYAMPPQQQQPGYPGYQGYPPPAQQSQAATTTVVLQQQAAPQQTVHVVHEDRPNHLLHAIICFFCPWYVFIWMIVCCIYGC